MQRRCFFPLALLISTCGWSTAPGQNVSRLYPHTQLEADAARYGEQIRAEYRETILPALSEEEIAALSAIKVEFPAAGPKGDPFEFYTDGSTVFLPALSLRFFADLCLANAWLNKHGFDGTTVRDYVGLLFREASLSPTAPLPPVFKTLGIPPDARDEPTVAQRGDRTFANTVVFLLAHELGHALRKHRPDAREPAQQRAQEIEADAFATEMMRRIGQIPLGLEFWFDLERIRHAAPLKFPTEAEWQKYLAGLRHPVTTERLEALAAAIEKAPDSFAARQQNQALWTARSRMFAQMFRMAAPFAGNSIARVAEYSRVRELRLAALKPRKAAFTAPGTTDTPEEDFQGFFHARRTFANGSPAAVMDILLLRDGDQVTGSYSTATGQGSIEGTVSDGVLRFAWKEGQSQGLAKLEADGAVVRGTWGNAEKEEGGGGLTGERRKRNRLP